MADRQIRLISAGLFERAKQYWLGAMASKGIVGLIGFAAAYYHDLGLLFSIAILVLEVVSSASFYVADFLKSKAEPILARLDYEESLGWRAPTTDLDEWIADFQKFEELGSKVRAHEPYFAQTGATGITVLRNNILESAFYTRTIAANARSVVFAILAVLSASFVTLLLSGAYRVLSAADDPVPQFVADALVALVTLDLFPLALRYGELAGAAARVRAQLGTLIAPTDAAVIPAVLEYQISRASAPLLPTFTFLARRLPLASIWSRHEPHDTDENPT